MGNHNACKPFLMAGADRALSRRVRLDLARDRVIGLGADQMPRTAKSYARHCVWEQAEESRSLEFAPLRRANDEGMASGSRRKVDADTH